MWFASKASETQNTLHGTSRTDKNHRSASAENVEAGLDPSHGKQRIELMMRGNACR